MTAIFRQTVVRSVCPLATLIAVLFAGAPVAASSHREAPAIGGAPRVDGTDFYMFRSYEPGRDGFVTLIANYNPLQDAYGGPNYFPLDDDAIYEIHIENDGDGEADVTFRFNFRSLPWLEWPPRRTRRGSSSARATAWGIPRMTTLD